MGFTPAEIDGMSYWEFMACIDGYRAANGATDDAEAPSVEEHIAFLAAVHKRDHG